MNRITKDFLESKIKHIEYVSHTTVNGQILRWCVLTMNNGFAVVGRPSACVDSVNDNTTIGERVAYENSFDKLWELEGYMLKEKLTS